MYICIYVYMELSVELAVSTAYKLNQYRNIAVENR